MRFEKGIKNSIIGILCTIITGFISMIKISLIVKLMGNEVNGYNNLINQIFGFLLIGEAGLGLATTTLLYKPISEKDNNKINRIISGSQISIIIVVGIIMSVAILVSFFVPIFIKGSTFTYWYIISTFILFSLKAIIPQLTQPLKSYALANQDEYYINLLKIYGSIITSIVEISVIYYYKNYLILLISGLITTLIVEFITMLMLKNKYKFLNQFQKEKEYSATKHMKELVKVNIVGTIARSIDPIVISKFIGIIQTSFYSNYSYIQNFILMIISTLLGSITHGFGDMFAKKEEQVYEKFNMYIMVSNFIATVSAILFFLLIQKFIPIWVTEKSLLSNFSAFLFAILIYVYSIMKPMNTLIVTNGYFKLASKSAIYESISNLILSLGLVIVLGVPGVLIASIVSYFTASFWYFPVKTYKEVFKVSSKEYFKKQGISIIILIGMIIILEKININPNVDITSFIVFFVVAFFDGIIIFTIVFFIYFIFFKDFRSLIYFLKDKLVAFIKLKVYK